MERGGTRCGGGCEDGGVRPEAIQFHLSSLIREQSPLALPPYRSPSCRHIHVWSLTPACYYVGAMYGV